MTQASRATKGATAAAEPARDQNVAGQVRVEVERAIQRGIRGLEYVTAGDPVVGQTPKTSIWSRGTLKLYHYHAQADEVYRVPLLLVMSLVSKPYILDLAPGQSLVEFLVKRGFDVYMIDWGVPRPEDCRLRLEDYVLDFLPECDREGRARQRRVRGLDRRLLHGRTCSRRCTRRCTPEGPLRNLACFTTPIDFDGMGLFKRWTDPKHFDVDRIVDSLGNVPPELLYASFNLLRPVSQAVGRVQLWDNLWNDKFVDVVPTLRPLGGRSDPVPRRVLPPDHQGAPAAEQAGEEGVRRSAGGPSTSPTSRCRSCTWWPSTTTSSRTKRRARWSRWRAAPTRPRSC